jgi:hypothetical protein
VLYDATGGYGAFFVSASAVCLIAAVLSLRIGRSPQNILPALAPA